MYRRAMSRSGTSLLALAAILFSTAGMAGETLYATSLRSQIGGRALLAGNLYVVDPATVSARLVGPIKVDDTPIGVVALATHPQTGVVYGITAGAPSPMACALVEIDLDNARARVVATLPMRGSDIGFDPQGALFMWAPDQLQLVKIDIATAAATPVGDALAGTSGGALVVSGDGREALLAVDGAQGRLLRIDLDSGQAMEGPRLNGAPYDASIDNLTLAPSGEVYGVNSDGGTPSKAALVTVDLNTGSVAKIGTLPDDVHGLIFAAARPNRWSAEMLRVWALAALGVVAAVIILYALLGKRSAGGQR